MHWDEGKLEQQLSQRRQQGNFRQLPHERAHLIDFSSNDYLGFARSPELADKLKSHTLPSYQQNGSTGSRLLTGNSKSALETEEYLSRFFLAPAVLLLGSGYLANQAFFSAVPQRSDTILYDELSHASIKDGCRQSLARRFSFLHNDLEDLKSKLSRSEGEKFVVVESVYSMDGDQAPLKELAAICEQHRAKLVVDEAHSTGIFGENGSGLVNELGLTDSVYARIFTFGKAMGMHGACIAGSETLKEYLINFSRPFIYTTAPSPAFFQKVRAAFEFLTDQTVEREELRKNIAHFQSEIRLPKERLIKSNSPIQAILIGDNLRTKALCALLEEKGMDVRPILSPTVKQGTERLRICLHSYNSFGQISDLCRGIHDFITKFE